MSTDQDDNFIVLVKNDSEIKSFETEKVKLNNPECEGYTIFHLELAHFSENMSWDEILTHI